MKNYACKGWLLLLLMLIAPFSATLAATTLGSLNYSPDIHINIMTTTISDESVVNDSLNSAPTVFDLGSLQPNTAVDGFHRLDLSTVLFSLETTADLGTLTARPGDVVRFDGTTYSLEFDAAAAGLASNVNVDAVTWREGLLILSFDTTVLLNGIVFADEDLAGFASNTFTMVFDGSSAGISSQLNLDAAQILGDNQLLLSFDSFGQVGGVLFSDEDILEYTPGSGVWELAFDASAAAITWINADMDAFAATDADEIFRDQFEN